MAESVEVALITGAAGGIGSTTAVRLARDGFRVGAFDINGDMLDALLPSIQPGGRTYLLDLTHEESVRLAVSRVEKEMGPIAALINVIGWTTNSKFAEETSDYWAKLIAINFQSLLYVTSAVVPGMIERRRGKIVNIASDAAKVGQSGEAVYAGCKGAVVAWSKSIARELARFGINVNCVAPGPTSTPLTAELDPELTNRVIRNIPFRRLAAPAEQAAAISFLCSADADFITGQVLSVSGGLTMQ